ncbi:MAG: GTPase Era [Gammaproteobacteria bacterium]|nr:GTPase Era [Gammaproteobacteria bacterium]
MSEQSSQAPRCGLAALIGRPNVGKSTLLNRLLGQKIAITSRKPQTTRHRILGICQRGSDQAIFVDTPGIHKAERHAINRQMNRTALAAMADVDVVILVIQHNHWTAHEDRILARIGELALPVILAVNKVDLVSHKADLLPRLAEHSQRYPFAAIIPVSARTGINVDALAEEVISRLPVSPPLFPEGQVTDRSEQFLAAEIVREKLMRSLGDELPYACSVAIEQFRETGSQTRIHAMIWVERESQKGIVIGQGGRRLKQVGEQARAALEVLLDRPVHLETWVKVRPGWRDDSLALKQFGYVEE